MIVALLCLDLSNQINSEDLVLVRPHYRVFILFICVDLEDWSEVLVNARDVGHIGGYFNTG